jgi:hypothetical protein
MIAPSTQGAAGLSGARGNPIRIRALNDGQVLIDGQFVRRPVWLEGNSWFVIEGINAKNFGNVLRLKNAHNNIIRRSIFWDGSLIANADIAGHDDSSFNLYEDVAFFGPGRKGYVPFGDSYGNVYRRIWVRWEGSTVGGGPNKFAFSVYYNNSPASSNGNIHENVLATWSGESMPETYAETDNKGNSIGTIRTNFALGGSPWVMARDHDFNNFCSNTKILGSIAYVKSSTVSPRVGLSRLHGIGTNNAADLARVPACVTYKDVLIIMSPSHPGFGSIPGFFFGSAGTNNSATYLSSVTGGSDTIPSSWNPSNNKHGTTVSDLTSQGANPWTGTTGANLCKRYVNGVKTNEPLWPWPMNDRIKAATASAGRYMGPCVECVGGRFARTPTDVTAEIEALLGRIPSQCRTS